MSDIMKANSNIFEDLAVAEPDEMLAKAELARKIQKILESKKLTQVQAAFIFRLKQPDMSDLVQGRLKKFSLERLLHFLNLLT